MGSVRDGRSQDSSLRRKAALLASVIVVAALVLGSLFGDRGIFQLFAQRDRTASLAREIDELQEENRLLAAQIRSLRRDPREIERLAREELGLARRGETVFLIRDEAPLHAE